MILKSLNSINQIIAKKLLLRKFNINIILFGFDLKHPPHNL